MKTKRLIVRIGRFAIRTGFSLVFFPASLPAQVLTTATFFRYNTNPSLYPGFNFTKAKLINNGISKSELVDNICYADWKEKLLSNK